MSNVELIRSIIVRHTRHAMAPVQVDALARAIDEAIDPEFWLVDEIAERWRVSKMTVYRMVESGTLPTMKVGKSIRVPDSALRAYEDSRSTGERVKEGGER